jgi:hypothetical protein
LPTVPPTDSALATRDDTRRLEELIATLKKAMDLIVHDQEVQFKRIAQLQADIDLVRGSMDEDGDRWRRNEFRQTANLHRLRTQAHRSEKMNGRTSPIRDDTVIRATTGSAGGPAYRRSCLSSGGKVLRVMIRRPDVIYAAFFTCPMS